MIFDYSCLTEKYFPTNEQCRQMPLQIAQLKSVMSTIECFGIHYCIFKFNGIVPCRLSRCAAIWNTIAPKASRCLNSRGSQNMQSNGGHSSAMCYVPVSHNRTATGQPFGIPRKQFKSTVRRYVRLRAIGNRYSYELVVVWDMKWVLQVARIWSALHKFLYIAQVTVATVQSSAA